MAEPQLKVALVALNAPGYQSLALAYVRAYAEAHERLAGKIAFQTLDLTVDTEPWWLAYRVLGLGADVVGFSVTCWNARKVYEACRVIHAARPETVIVLGGPEVGPIAEEVLAANPAVTAVVRGEGEETFAELLRVLIAGKRAWMVDGVTARKGEEVVSAPDRALIEDLDGIPSPYLAGVLEPLADTAYLETYRGCPHRCGYCFEGKGYTRVRSFSKERVLAEIEALAKAPGLRCFSFVDSVFNLTPERLSWLTEALEPHVRDGIRLHTIEVDIERVDDRTASELLRAGVASVETGPQSVGHLALQTCRRSFDPVRFVEGVAACRRAGISVECDLIIGLPGDDAYDVVAGLRWLVDLDPGFIQASTLHVLPGTDLFVRAEELGLRFDPEPGHEVISTQGISFRDLRRLEVMSGALRSAYRARLGTAPGA
jgi:radical SAM superfamily enzyme YgiQ (UPF0313 family)